MKKKKLKKKLRELRKKLRRDDHYLNYSVLELADKMNFINERVNALEKVKIDSLKEKVTSLENDNKYYKEWMDRSGVDYKSWFNFDEKTCDTCKWYPLSKQGGQDIPCMGCTADDKKMWKSKGD